MEYTMDELLNMKFKDVKELYMQGIIPENTMIYIFSLNTDIPASIIEKVFDMMKTERK